MTGNSSSVIGKSSNPDWRAIPGAQDAGFIINLHSHALRLTLDDPVRRNGKELFEVPICVTGSWVKGSRTFSITRQDLAAMARNFEKRKNEQVVIDYEHASEQPEIARGGPVIAAGWIHALRLPQSGVDESGVSHSAVECKADSGLRAPDILTAFVEWTPQAIEMIGTGQYRFFSPAIDWACCDKESGEPQGATLTSGALTNHPFLEELPAITLSDIDKETAPADPSNLPSERPADRPLNQVSGGGEREENMRKLTIKRLTEGPLEGHHGIYGEDDETLGYLDAGDFANYINDEAEDASLSAMLRESGLTAGDSTSARQQVVEQLRLASDARAREQESAGRRLLLTEATKDGALDNHRAAQLARQGRITLADYVAAQDADRKLEEAVRAGKILPRDRRFFFHDALERPREFAEYLKQAVPVVRLGVEGIGTAGGISVDDEIKMRAQRLMTEEKTSFAKALRKVLAADRELEHRYHAVHRKQVGCDPGVATGSDGRGITA